ncbi:MAG: hypothetical protein AAF206_18540 [Bacteroidota bacterium]
MKQKWMAFAENFSVSQEDAESIFDQMNELYTAPRRAYHNWQHIAEMLNWLEKWKSALDGPIWVEAAIWFHDVVYQPGEKDNEIKSARMAEKVGTQWGMPADQIQVVSDMILSTTTHQPQPDTADCRWLLDLDLAILGAPVDRYDEYATQIRAEYHSYPDQMYKAGRKMVLEAFLQKERLYFNDEMVELLLEAHARESIRREISGLK